MGRFDVENSYVLQELENKLNNEDVQKWLESQGPDLLRRKVANFVSWLELCILILHTIILVAAMKPQIMHGELLRILSSR